MRDPKRSGAHEIGSTPSSGDVRCHGACRAVDGDGLTVVELAGGVAGADDGGDAVFAGDEGSVGGAVAAVGDDGGGAVE